MMLTITTNSFENDVLHADKPVLVDFWAQWCPYCRRIAPAFDKVGELYADTLITPISDSFLDLSVIADIDFETQKIKNPSHYATHVWEVKKHLAAQGKAFLNWIVVGNKISPFQSNNQKQVFDYLKKLEKLYGFRTIIGIKDRAIYKEMFLEGLTVLDMQNEALKMKMSMSHLAAKREIFKLAEFISPK